MGPPCMTVPDRVEYWKRVERLKTSVDPEDVRWFYAAIPADARPMTSWEKTKVPEGTPIHMIARIGRRDDGFRLHIAGSTPALGEWAPNTVAFDFKGPIAGGYLWDFHTKMLEAAFKLTYGRPGDDWPGSGEWTGPPDRMLPDPSATAFSTEDGDVYLVYEFGIMN